jgi:host factor-I protein
MTDFDTGLPSIRQMQKYIKDKQEVELKLVTDDLLVGKISWLDPDYLCLVDHYDQPILIRREAVVYLKQKA